MLIHLDVRRTSMINDGIIIPTIICTNNIHTVYMIYVLETPMSYAKSWRRNTLQLFYLSHLLVYNTSSRSWVQNPTFSSDSLYYSISILLIYIVECRLHPCSLYRSIYALGKSLKMPKNIFLQSFSKSRKNFHTFSYFF